MTSASTPCSTSTTPVRAAATAATGVTVRISRFLARRARAGSTTAHCPRSLRIGVAAWASWSISSGVSGSPWRASCQLNEKRASGVSSPVCNGSSRGPGSRRSRTARAVRSRPRLRGQSTSTSWAASAATPSSSRLTSSSVSRVMASGMRSSSSRSSTGHASAARRSASTAWVRARSPKPWAAPSPVQSRAASQNRSGSCSSWTCATTRIAPATSSSSSASTRSAIRTNRAGSRDVPGGRAGRASTTAAASGWASGSLGRQWPSAGSNRPPATSRSPASAAAASSATVGSAPSPARSSTGSASRIGSTTAVSPSPKLTVPSRGGSPASNLAGPTLDDITRR